MTGMISQDMIAQQVNEIQQAMKQAGKWKPKTPEWVYSYKGGSVPDFWEWLQFIYLPMRLSQDLYPPHLLAPVLAEHVQTKPELEKILSLVIELDNLTPTVGSRE